MGDIVRIRRASLEGFCAAVFEKLGLPPGEAADSAEILVAADARGIPYQIRQPGGGGTNTGAIQRAAAGIPVATLAVPGRYAHTPTMMISLDDYENVVRLADAALRGLTPDIVRR